MSQAIYEDTAPGRAVQPESIHPCVAQATQTSGLKSLCRFCFATAGIGGIAAAFGGMDMVFVLTGEAPPVITNDFRLGLATVGLLLWAFGEALIGILTKANAKARSSIATVLVTLGLVLMVGAFAWALSITGL